MTAVMRRASGATAQRGVGLRSLLGLRCRAEVSWVLTGSGTSRTTLTQWGSDGRFASTLTNALNQSVTQGWDAALGVPASGIGVARRDCQTGLSPASPSLVVYADYVPGLVGGGEVNVDLDGGAGGVSGCGPRVGSSSGVGASLQNARAIASDPLLCQ